MPELPEVQTIVNDLNKHTSGFVIKRVVTAKNYKIYPDAQTYISKLTGAIVTKADRIAKNILIHTNRDVTAHFHLAMTGRILLRELSKKDDRWIKVLLVLSDGKSLKNLIFTDTRMFGKAGLLSGEDLETLRKKYGMEPVDKKNSWEDFYKLIKNKKTNIKTALLDQSLVAGLGNIYATDALFVAGIHPKTKCNQLTPDAAKALWEAARTQLLEGIEHRGSTLADKMYVDLLGESGSHQDYFKIYSKTTCLTCKTKTSTMIIGGRTTYFCPTCQPEI